MLVFALQEGAGRVPPYVGGLRFVGVLLIIMLVLGIIVLAKKLMK